MADFRVEINNIAYDVVNLDSLTFTHSLREQCYILTDIPLELELCDAAALITNESGTFFSNDAICTEITAILQHRACSTDAYTDVGYFNVPMKDLSYDCERCVISMSLTQRSIIQSLLDNSSVEFCAECSETGLEACLTQFQSGGILRDTNGNPITRCFFRFSDLITALADQFYESSTGVSLIGSLFTQQHISQEHVVTIPSFNANDVFTLTITTQLGSRFQVTVLTDNTTTQNEVAQRLANALLYVDDQGSVFDIDIDEVIHRLSDATVDNNQLTIVSDYPLNSIDLQLNFVSQVSAVAETVPYQFGLSNMVISSKNLIDDANFCINWSSLVSFIKSVNPAVISQNRNELDISSYDEKYDTTAAGSLSVSDRFAKLSLDTQFMKELVLLGYEPELENLRETRLNWKWVDNAVDICTDFEASLTHFNDVYTPFVAADAGNIALDGWVQVTNSTGSAVNIGQLQILVDGVEVANNFTAYTLPNGQSISIAVSSLDGTFDLTFKLDTSVSVCVDAASTIEYVMLDDTLTQINNLTVNPGDCHLTIDTLIFDTSFPVIDEHLGLRRGVNGQSTLVDYEDCKGVIENEIPSDYYTGLGYAVYQRAFDLADYDQHFVNFIETSADPDCAFQTKNFQRSFYFDSSAFNPCRADQTVAHYYHNLIISLPFLRMHFADMYPGVQRVLAYNFVRVVDATGAINASSDDSEYEGVIGPFARHIREYEYEDCMSFDDFRTLISENKLNFTFCNEAQKTGIVVTAGYNFNSSAAQFKVRSE